MELLVSVIVILWLKSSVLSHSRPQLGPQTKWNWYRLYVCPCGWSPGTHVAVSAGRQPSCSHGALRSVSPGGLRPHPAAARDSQQAPTRHSGGCGGARLQVRFCSLFHQNWAPTLGPSFAVSMPINLADWSYVKYSCLNLLTKWDTLEQSRLQCVSWFCQCRPLDVAANRDYFVVIFECHSYFWLLVST